MKKKIRPDQINLLLFRFAGPIFALLEKKFKCACAVSTSYQTLWNFDLHNMQLKKTRWLDTNGKRSFIWLWLSYLLHLISCSTNFYIMCSKSVTFVLNTVSQKDKHKMICRLVEDDRDQDLLFLSSWNIVPNMHGKLFHHMRQKCTVSRSLRQGNHAIIQFSMACSHSHLIAFFLFFFRSVGPIFCTVNPSDNKLIWSSGWRCFCVQLPCFSTLNIQCS